MAVYEWMVAACFTTLTLAAWLLPLRARRRVQASALGAAVLLTLFGVAPFAPQMFRDWVPVAYLIAGYWMPALLVRSSAGTRFEEWLRESDARFRRNLPEVPQTLRPVTELGYLLCYPMVPLSFAVVWLNGGAADVQRFWLAVLLAGYACYVTLPWLVSRPPRLQPGQVAPPGALQRLNALVLGRVSHRLNTFPSGHVAVAAAAAASVAVVSVPAGALLAGVVAAISVGAAAGGYHYAIDVVSGLAIAAAAVILAGIP
jgi:membrane-associated phospholipid phosphatase